MRGRLTGYTDSPALPFVSFGPGVPAHRMMGPRHTAPQRSPALRQSGSRAGGQAVSYDG
jgi:hypothetical protein